MVRRDDRKVIQISAPLHAWLTEVKEAREAELGRAVTFTEILEDATAIHRPVRLARPEPERTP